MKIIKTYENYNLDDLDLGRFEEKIDKSLLIPNEDGTFDYNGDLDLSQFGLTTLTNIPIRFRKVNGSFYCSGNPFYSLKGCPPYIKEDFYCSFTDIISLQYAPEEVGGDFWYSSLTNLLSDFCLTKIKGDNIINSNYRIKTYDLKKTIKRMSYQEQMAELDFFDKYDIEASKFFQEVLIGMGINFGTHRKEMIDKVGSNDNLKALGLGF